MSFALIEPALPARMPVTLCDIERAARTACGHAPRLRAISSILRGQVEENSSIHALARLLVAGDGGPIDATYLAGSFHPLTAQSLMVGKRR